MDIGNIILLAVMAAVIAVIYLGCSVAALRFQRPQLKQTGMILTLVGAGFWLMVFIAAMSNGVAPDFQERFPGPARGGGSATREVLYSVTNRGVTYEVTLRLLSSPDVPAEGMKEVRFQVLDRNGKEIVNGNDSVGPNVGIEWNRVRFAFTPEYEGEHRLVLEIPGGVDMVEMKISEYRD